MAPGRARPAGAVRRAGTAAALVAAVGCAATSTGPTPPPPPGQSGFTIVGAGDIAWCGSPGAEATARLLDRIPGVVFTTGDNAYMSGRREDFRDCYESSWGRHKDRTRPTPGNHDYETAGASGYFDYFGGAAGERGQGYYTYAVGPWRIYALNSEIDMSPGSPQLLWLRSQLAANPSSCSAAIWHRPLFTSGPNGENPDTRPLWRLLYEFNVDVILNGHDHLYERFAPMDPEGRLDFLRGIRQFTAGGGGAPLYQAFGRAMNSEMLASVWGVLKLTLSEGFYSWEHVSAGSTEFQDAGTALCH